MPKQRGEAARRPPSKFPEPSRAPNDAEWTTCAAGSSGTVHTSQQEDQPQRRQQIASSSPPIAKVSPTIHALPMLRPLPGSNGESLVRAFTRESRLARSQSILNHRASLTSATHHNAAASEERDDSAVAAAAHDDDGGQLCIKADDVTLPAVFADTSGMTTDNNNAAGSLRERRHGIPPPLLLHSSSNQQQQHLTAPSPRGMYRPSMMVGVHEFRSIASLDDFNGLKTSGLLSSSGVFSPLFPRPDDAFTSGANVAAAAASTTVTQSTATSTTSTAAHQLRLAASASPAVVTMTSILSPRLLHLKPELTHPAVIVAPVEVNLREFSPKLLQKHGRTSINWNRVRKVTCTPFQNAVGLSEATMYHCVLDVMAEHAAINGHEGGVGPNGNTGGSYGTTSSPSPLNVVPLPVWKQIWQRAKLSVARKRASGLSTSGDAGHIGGAGHIQGGEDEGFPVLYASRDGSCRSGGSLPALPPGSLNNFDLFNLDAFAAGSVSMVSSMRSSLALPAPPSFLVLKHYNTSIVESTSVLLRIARHLTATTAEKMVAHEIFFYSKLSGFFCEANSPFRCPKPMFISQRDRGDPGFFRYVCCGTGSGTVASIALEDMQRSGFSFDHTQGDGLFDETVIYSVLIALAYMHSTLWDRCHEPLLQKLEPASIIVFVHRCSPKLQSMRPKNEFAKVVHLQQILDRWTSYGPTSYLAHRSAQAMVHYIRSRWDVIRADAMEIIGRRDTMLHGDVHYKNIGFRTKYASSTGGSHTRRKSTSQQQTGGAGNGNANHTASDNTAGGGGGGMLHRYFSTDNAVLARDTSTYSTSSPTATDGTLRPTKFMSHGSHNRAAAGGGSVDHSSNNYLDAMESSIPQLHGQQQQPQHPHDPTTPLAKQSAEAIDIQPCFLDYQNCGPGSIAAELLYFLCTSVPVEVDLDSHSYPLVDIDQIDKLKKVPSTSSINPAGTSPPPSTSPATVNSNSFAGLLPPSMMPTESSSTDDAMGVPSVTFSVASGAGGGRTRADSTAANHRAPHGSAAAASSHQRTTSGQQNQNQQQQQQSCSSSSAGGTRLKLHELLSFDVMLITTYHQNLDLQVQVAYPLASLIHDVYLLARHWAGCIMFDMASTPPEERIVLKRLTQYSRLITWGERTAERCYAMCVAVFTEVDGPQLQAQLAAQEQQAARSNDMSPENPAAPHASPSSFQSN